MRSGISNFRCILIIVIYFTPTWDDAVRITYQDLINIVKRFVYTTTALGSNFCVHSPEIPYILLFSGKVLVYTPPPRFSSWVSKTKIRQVRNTNNSVKHKREETWFTLHLNIIGMDETSTIYLLYIFLPRSGPGA